METKNRRWLRRVISLMYSAGVISLIIGVLLSVVNQPVYASSQSNSNGGDKVWICHVPPGNPSNSHAIYVDANGWNGHSNHPGDFLLNGPDDPRCGGPEPTSTTVPTEIVPTDTQVPTEVKPTETGTTQPTVGQEPTSTNTPTTEPTSDHKVWICHIPPGNPNNPLALFVDANGWNGHSNHPDDFLINGPDDPRCAVPTSTPTTNPTDTATIVVGVTQTPADTATQLPSSTPTATATEPPTATNTPTATYTATSTPTDTATPTATTPAFKRLSVSYECVNGQQLWTITNPNPFTVHVEWSFSSGPGPGSADIPANSSMNFYVAGGYRTITVTWNDGESNQSLNMTTSPTSPCAINPTRTPTEPSEKKPTIVVSITATPHRSILGSTPRPTFVATLKATLNPSQEVLIPVTGADFTNPFQNMPLNSIFLNLGFVFLGAAFVTHGITFKLK